MRFGKLGMIAMQARVLQAHLHPQAEIATYDHGTPIVGRRHFTARGGAVWNRGGVRGHLQEAARSDVHRVVEERKPSISTRLCITVLI